MKLILITSFCLGLSIWPFVLALAGTEVSRRLLESTRMRFTHLDLWDCAHFGLQGVCEIPWNNVPELWPQLEKLTLHYPHVLTLDTLAAIIIRFKHLKTSRIPRKRLLQSLLSTEEEPNVDHFNEKLNNLLRSCKTSVSAVFTELINHCLYFEGAYHYCKCIVGFHWCVNTLSSSNHIQPP